MDFEAWIFCCKCRALCQGMLRIQLGSAVDSQLTKDINVKTGMHQIRPMQFHAAG
jgi:hypothetical protein